MTVTCDYCGQKAVNDSGHYSCVPCGAPINPRRRTKLPKHPVTDEDVESLSLWAIEVGKAAAGIILIIGVCIIFFFATL